MIDDPDQEAIRSEMVAFALEHPDSLLRTCQPGHFTGSALILDAAGERALLLFHTKAQQWFQPGGHADGQADLSAVARREAEEETGIAGLEIVRPAIDFDIHVFRPREGPAHRHLDVRFLFRAPAGARAVGNHESEALRWVTYDELVALGADAGLRRLARRAFALPA